jgi:hypothetical protein
LWLLEGQSAGGLSLRGNTSTFGEISSNASGAFRASDQPEKPFEEPVFVFFVFFVFFVPFVVLRCF